MTTAFAAQKVSLDLSRYSGVLVTGAHANTSIANPDPQTAYAEKGTNNRFITLFTSATTGAYAQGRAVTVDNTGVTFSNAGTPGSYSPSANVIIPAYIYGV